MTLPLSLHLPLPFCSRPTAVNLADAAQRLSKLAADAAAQSDATAESVTMAVVEACEAMLRDDVEANRVGGACYAML